MAVQNPPPQNPKPIPASGQRIDVKSGKRGTLWKASDWVSLGPGLVFALTVIGPGDVFSNATAGSQYGYSLLWTLVLSLVFRFVWVSTSAKYVLVTGQSLFSGYASLGRPVVWILLISLLFIRHLSNMYLIVIMGSAPDTLLPPGTPFSRTAWSLLLTLLGYGVMRFGSYRAMGRLFQLVIAVWIASLAVAALAAQPDPAAIFRGITQPSLPGNTGRYAGLLVLMALIGTESGSLTNLTYAYFIHRRGWRSPALLRRQRCDLLCSVACIFVLCSLLQVSAAETLRPLGIQLQSTEDVGRLWSQGQGRIGAVVFVLGLTAASFTTFVGGTTGFALMITDICRNFLPAFRRPPGATGSHGPPENDRIYRTALALWTFSPLYVFFTEARPVWLVLFVSSLVVILIPFLVTCLLLITNDGSRMGRYKNRWTTNALLVLLLATSLSLLSAGAHDFLVGTPR